MRAFAKKPATYDDVKALPEGMVGQIVAGELLASPRPAYSHSVVTTGLGSELFDPFHRGRGGPGGWWLGTEPELHLGQDILVPDLAGWRRSRCPEPPGGAFVTVAPDWVCEILSPSTAWVDRERKLPIYAREHVAFAWIIDPGARTLEVLKLLDKHWVVAGNYSRNELVRVEPFEAIEMDLGALWLPEVPDERAH